MPSTRTFPSLLYFDTRLFCFEFTWSNPGNLKIQAIKKSQISKCYRGQIKGDDKKSLQQIKRLYQYMEVKLAMTQRDQIDHLSSVITVIDRSDQLVSEFRLRIMIVEGDKTDIKEVSMKMQIVGESYFLMKKVQRLEHQKQLDRQMLANVWQQKQHNTQKIDEIKQQMQQMNLNKQLQGLINSVKSIQSKLEGKPKNRHHKKKQEEGSSDSQNQQAKEINIKQLQKKLRKKIKKEIKKKKKDKRRRRKLKKEKKEHKRLKKALKKAQLEDQAKGGIQVENSIYINSDNRKPIIISNEQEQHKINQNQVLNIDDLYPQDNEGRREEKKKKKEKHRHREKREDINFIIPQKTSVLNMSKLRNRDANEQVLQHIHPIDIQSPQILIQQTKQKKEKKSKKNKKRQSQVNNQQMGQNEGQKQYYRKLEEIRKQGNIEQARLARINRLKAALKPKQPVILEEDEFNPKYNGQPKYKPFVSHNQFQLKRPRDIFPERLQVIHSQCRKIPIIFRQQITSYKNFDVNGNVVRKISGFNYQQMVIDYPIPNSGRHILTMRSVVSKRQYTWFGVIDIRQKDRQSSYDRKYCIAFSFRTGHVSTNEKWGRQKLGCLPQGSLVSMEVDMDRKAIVWHTSGGKNNIASIPKAFQKITLVPYFQLMDIQDEVMFEQSI